MMIDPMFMIYQNLRLFLTTVTPTDVAPTAVILWNEILSLQFRHVCDMGHKGEMGGMSDMDIMVDMGDIGDLSFQSFMRKVEMCWDGLRWVEIG